MKFRWRRRAPRPCREHSLLRGIDPKALGLEIGPSHSPIAPKRSGFNVRILDHLDASGLRTKYADHGVDTSAIEDVDYIWRGEALEQLVNGVRFEWIVASHVIEHVPDLIGFLNSCERILAPGGILSLAVPDKRYCFDCERENSSLARVIDAGLTKPVTHTPGTAAEHFLKVRRKGGKIAWKDGHRGALEPVHGPQDAVRAMTAAKDGVYQDLHAWVFTDESFRQLIRDLRDLHLINLEERSFSRTQGCEFFATLARADANAAGSISPDASQGS